MRRDGEWLRQELTRRGYDLRYGGQSQFSRDAGIHVSIVSRALKGVPVSLDVLRRMADPLGYTLGDMLILSGTASRGELTFSLPEEVPSGGSQPVTAADLDAMADRVERQVTDATAATLAKLDAVLAALQARDVNGDRPSP